MPLLCLMGSHYKIKTQLASCGTVSPSENSVPPGPNCICLSIFFNHSVPLLGFTPGHAEHSSLRVLQKMLKYKWTLLLTASMYSEVTYIFLHQYIVNLPFYPLTLMHISTALWLKNIMDWNLAPHEYEIFLFFFSSNPLFLVLLYACTWLVVTSYTGIIWN